MTYMAKRRGKGEPRQRDFTVPMGGWWGLAVKRQLAEAGLTQEWLAEHLGVTAGHVSRVIANETPSYGDVRRICFVLKLPLPVIVPENEEIALELAKQHRLVRRDFDVFETIPGATEPSKIDQMAAIAYENALRERRSKEIGSSAGVRPG